MTYDDTYENLEWFVSHYQILEGYDLSKIDDKEIFEAICEDICVLWQALDKGPLLHQDAVEDWVTNQF